MLAKLVSFDTETAKSNLALIAFVEDYLQSWNVPYVRVPNAAGDKAALYATIGPQDKGGVVLSGHTDVVPVAGQNWTSDPFTLRVENGRAYGRGAVDMKAFDALALALIPEFQAANLKTPIHILLSYDEETTCLGVVDTIRKLGHDLPLPNAAIVGEPTMLEVVDAHKSVVTFTTTVHGSEAHSSKPYLGASAVMTAAELITELNRIGDEMIERGDTSGRFDPALHNGACGRDLRRHGAQYHLEVMQLRLGVPWPSKTRTRRKFPTGSRGSLTKWRSSGSTASANSAGSRPRCMCMCRASRLIPAPMRRHWPCGSLARTARRRCRSEPKPDTFRRQAFPLSCADRARSIRRIRRMSTSRSISLKRARPSCAAWRRSAPVHREKPYTHVIAALVAGIHVFKPLRFPEAAIRRKAGHDGVEIPKAL